MTYPQLPQVYEFFKVRAFVVTDTIIIPFAFRVQTRVSFVWFSVYTFVGFIADIEGGAGDFSVACNSPLSATDEFYSQKKNKNITPLRLR